MPLIHTLNNVRNERNAVQIFHSTHTTTTTIVQKTCFKKEISTYIHTYIHTCIYGPTSNLRREACNAPHHPFTMEWTHQEIIIIDLGRVVVVVVVVTMVAWRGVT